MIKQRECTNSIGIVNWKTFLTDVNSSLNNFWTINEIDSVSSKLSCNPLQNLGEIFDYGLLKPVARKIISIETKDPIIKDPIIKDPIIKYYSLRNYEPDQGILYSTKLFDGNLLSILETKENIVFAPTLIAPNKKENISQLLYETFTIKEEGTNDNILSAIGFYFDDSTSIISTIDSANYAVIGSTGIYDGAKRVKIEFFNNLDFLRKITVYFE
jgi:hypothetical protein